MIFYCFSIYFFLRPIWPSKPRRVKNVPRCLNEKRRDLKNQAPSLAAEDFYQKKKRNPEPQTWPILPRNASRNARFLAHVFAKNHGSHHDTPPSWWFPPPGSCRRWSCCRTRAALPGPGIPAVFWWSLDEGAPDAGDKTIPQRLHDPPKCHWPDFDITGLNLLIFGSARMRKCVWTF